MDLDQFAMNGFALVTDVVPPRTRTDLLHAFDTMLRERAGTRDGLSHPAVRALAASSGVRAVVEPVLGERAFAYRATLFDKTPTANWLVAWHQDLVVPVQERRDVPGFGPWSQKHGVWYVQPPVEVLRGVVAVRVDIDGSDADNGALRVLPGSHQHGVLASHRIAELASGIAPVTCRVPAGGALRMRPLLLHASSRAPNPGHRRVVHLEFTNAPLPGGMAFPHCLGS